MINKFISGLKPDQRKILAVVSVLVILGLFYVLLLRPVLHRSNEIDALIVKEQETVRKNTRFLAKREQVIKEAGAFKDYFTKDVRAEEEVIADLLKKVELLATQAGVQMSKISPAGQDVQNDYIKYLVSVDCSGALESLTNFMYAINNSQDLTRVEKMNIGSNAKSADTVQASFTISKMIIGADPSVDARTLVRVQENKEAPKSADASRQ
ncbi:MAG: type 4a pilus biogenesis protein PilO [Candidatus Omnitrophica bacterium]|nr:type 4a pilus biogenesis protein PilO [Candidatus Omnitrophota bacterium]